MRQVVLGWDSATWDVVDPLVEAGRLPVMADLLESGARAPLRSVWPPMTDCAWTSAFTGRNPGAHGIFGSWYRAPGRYACRYFSARDRRVPALWEIAEDARFLIWNVPMTYPPSEVAGAMVAGYGAPPGADITTPADLGRALAGRWPLEDLLDRAPHGSLERFRDDLLRGLRAQADALVWAADEVGADCVVAVWPQVDRAQHFFWRFRGTDHPLADAVDDVYEAIDAATGILREAWPEADLLVVSDHGAGTLEGDVNLGAWLVRNGYAAAGGDSGNILAKVAWAMPPTIRRLGRRVAPGLARRTMAATLTGQLGSFRWEETRAFVGFHGDLWLNLEGREEQGTISPDQADEVTAEIATRLLELEDPRRGTPVFSAVHERGSIYSGAALDLAPDLMLDSWSAGYRVAPSRDPAGDLVTPPLNLAGVDEAWSSDHRPIGILAAAGPNIARASLDEMSLMDVCPTVLALMGQRVPSDLDGRVALDLATETFLERNPVRTGDEAGVKEAGGAFSDEEAAAVAAHLKDLGYIE